jgi:hypothetical protein
MPWNWEIPVRLSSVRVWDIPALLFALAQLAFEIPATVSDCHDLHPCFENPEGDCRPALETDGAQTRHKVIALGATFGKWASDMQAAYNRSR